MQPATNISIIRAVATRCVALAGTLIAIMWFHSSLKYVAEAFAPFMVRPISTTLWIVICATAFFFAALVTVFLIHRLPWRPGILWVAAVLLLYCWPALSRHPDAASLGDFPVLTPNRSTIDPGGENPGVRYTQNNHGFRGADWQLEKAPGVVRGVVIGDSFVYGAAVNDNETLPFQLEACLHKTRPDVEVLNLGIPGHNILGHTRLFELAHDYLNPDFVILCLYENDFVHWDTGVARERLLKHPLARPPTIPARRADVELL